jgi:Ca-activated chloride channel family protein
MKTDDPKFTAHALGEIDDLTPAEIAEIEALLESNPSAAAEAAETQTLAARLRRELQGEEAHALTSGQRAKVLEATHAEARAKKPKVVPFSRQSVVLSAIAASVIVGLFATMFHLAMKANRAALNHLSAAPNEGEVGITHSVEDLPVPTEEALGVSPETVAASPYSPPNINSPNINVASTTAQTNFFKVAPAQVRVNITTNASDTARATTNHLSMAAAGSGTLSLGDLPGTMLGRIDGSRTIQMWEVDRQWARPYRRFDHKPVERNEETEPANAEAYDAITDNAFLAVRENPLSTFSTDVDTASYAIVRRFLNEQQLPPKGAVRIEEMLNYFTYDYPQPKGDAPFSATMEVATCPWTPAHRLVRIGLKGREIAKDKRPASNLVFLIDVSGSMSDANKLPLLKRSLGLLIDQLGEEDRVAMAVYAGSSGCVLEPTHDKAKMRRALDRLEAGGSTNGGSGIQLAYDIAQRGFIKGGTNRVILATDGDWNVGITSESDLLEMIAKKAKGGVFLTVLGFGMGNLKDSMLVKLADKGNGNYGYIDTLLEAKKLLVDQLGGTLVTIAKDVKIQVEFNPAQVTGYRLIGYEKRLLAKEDFNDDKKDAGEIGAGHTVTALYEIVPAGKDMPVPAKVDALKYQAAPAAEEPRTKNQEPGTSPELLTLKLRYKAPDGDTSKLLEFPLTDTGATWEKSTHDFRFAAAVAGYGMLLRDSPHKGRATWDSVRELAVEGKGGDATGYRAEFISLLEKAQSLSR